MEQLFCQSCGMPLHLPEEFGSNKDGIKVEDYCLYCFKDGEFTSNSTMEEMIEICSKYVEASLRKQAVSDMKIQFPKLKRWAKKEETQNEYHKSINKVLDYINEHLNKNPDLETLSRIANISPFHFHRIFKAIIGENLGEYIQRLRLEYVASHLKASNSKLSDLAERTGYNTQQALSKAFKKHFGTSPTHYKLASYKSITSHAHFLSPKICNLKQQNVVYIRIIDEYGSPESYTEAWKKLYIFASQNNLLDEKTESIGISFDDPSVTNAEKCRFYACFTTDKQIKATGAFGSRPIEGGKYAIFTLKGAYKGLNELYKTIWFSWLPSSKYKIRKGTSYEKYLNNPNQVCEEDILTEIYVPIEEQTGTL